MKKKRSFSIKYLFFVYVLFITVSFTAAILFGIKSFKQNQKNLANTSEIQLNGLVNRFDLSMKSVQYSILELAQNKDLVSYQQTFSEESPSKEISMRKNIMDHFKMSISSSLVLGEIIGYWPQTETFIYSNGGELVAGRNFPEKIGIMKKSGWYTFNSESLYYVNFNPISVGNYPKSNYNYMVIGKVQSDYLGNLVKEMKTEPNVQAFIMTGTEDKVPDSLPHEVKKACQKVFMETPESKSITIDYKDGKKNYTLIGKKSKKTHLWFFYNIHLNYYPSTNREVLIPISLLLFFLIILASALLLLFYFNYYKYLKILDRAFQKSKKGDYSFRIADSSNNEFKNLFLGFNEMNQQTMLLIDRLKTETSLKEEAEYRQLQAQINPHFLYNNFNFILSVAEKSPKTVVLMTHHLAEYYRYLTNKNIQNTTLIQELNWAENYLTIMSLRKGIDYFIDYPEELAEIPFMALLLQPLVENAIYHGIENRIGSSQIGITVEKKGKKIVVSVMDDGKGMTKEEIRKLKKRINSLKETKSGEGKIGLWNVNQRLINQFGVKSAIQIKQGSELGEEGITFYFTIPNPLIEKKES